MALAVSATSASASTASTASALQRVLTAKGYAITKDSSGTLAYRAAPHRFHDHLQR